MSESQMNLPWKITPPLSARIQATQKTTNPLLEAARILLEALAEVPAELDAESIIRYRQWLINEFKLFDAVCTKTWVLASHVKHARYCLCSALDEAIAHTQWGNDETRGTDWSTAGLAVSLGYDRQGGDRVFRIINEALREPQGNRDLLEVLRNILDLGFRGHYRFRADGREQLQAIRASLQWVGTTAILPEVMNGSTALAYIDTSNPRQQQPLILAWNSSPPPAQHEWKWLFLFTLVAAIVGGATYFGYVMYQRNELTRQTLLSLQAQQGQQLQQAQALDTLIQRLDTRLRNEITANTASLVPNANHTLFTLSFSDMFSPGESTLNPWVSPLIAAVGQETATLPVKVRVIGYTDSMPLNGKPQATNQSLSKERADTVTQILRAAGVAPERVVAEGGGETNPIANNTTDDGRTKNRRVEMTFERLDVQ